MSPIAIIGGGPAGLMAATLLLDAGQPVALYDAMPSVGRKFLLAGRGGLNLTHSEPLEQFLPRYGRAEPLFRRALAAFPPQAARDLAHRLGIETFVGSSGRVFPTDFKAAPMLRAWLRHLKGRGLALHMRHRWTGFDVQGALCFDTPDGVVSVTAPAALLALGGASWPHLGSDGAWVPLLRGDGLQVAELQPSNCGFSCPWSEPLRRHAGTPLKTIALTFDGRTVKGEMVLTEDGIEGGAVYALSGPLRDAVLARGGAVLHLDLRPALTIDAIAARLEPRGGLSLSSLLKKRLKLPPAAVALLREGADPAELADSRRLAARLKACPIPVTAPRPIAEAISSAGGLCLEGLTDSLMLRSRPGVFAAGEMLDWEAPTGGYLLQGCLATGALAAQGMLDWLAVTTAAAVPRR